MALLTINDVGILSGTIARPLVGVWSADLVIDGIGFPAGTSVTIRAPGYELKGVVAPARSGDFLDASHVRVLGGKGGMARTAKARSYVQPGAFTRDVVNGLASDAGETLSSTVSASFLTTNLTAWSVMAEPVARALQTLLDVTAPLFSWRILADGTLWVGAETWPAANGTLDILSQDPADGSFDIGVESPFVAPGTMLDGVGRVSRVEEHIGPDRVVTRVWTEIGADRGVASAVQAIVAHAMAGVDYFGLYEAKVMAQSGDLSTVDVELIPPVNQRIAGQRAEVREGNGFKVQFAPGSKVLLGWKGGDPSKPYVCTGLSSDGVQRLQIGGNTDAARKNDPVGNGTIVFSFVGGTGGATLSVTYNPGDGSTPQVLASGNGTLTIKEKIVLGSTVVGLG